MGIRAGTFAVATDIEQKQLVQIGINEVFYQKVLEERQQAFDNMSTHDPSTYATSSEFQIASIKLYEEYKHTNDLLEFLDVIRGYLKIDQQTKQNP